MDETELVPLSDEDQTAGFDVVLRGYDRRQVDDYLDRVEVALAEADQRHAEDAQRLSALERQVSEHQERLVDAERRAAGRPEPATVVGDRIATMLRLAEEEAEAVVAEAAKAGDELLAQARQRADDETAERSAELDRRQAALRQALEQADTATLQAQQDAEGIRARAAEEAELSRRAAEEQAQQLHQAAQQEAAAMTAEARRQVEELSRQRDAIAAQLQHLRDTLSGAVGPLSAPVDEPTQAYAPPGGRLDGE